MSSRAFSQYLLCLSFFCQLRYEGNGLLNLGRVSWVDGRKKREKPILRQWEQDKGHYIHYKTSCFLKAKLFQHPTLFLLGLRPTNLH